MANYISRPRYLQQLIDRRDNGEVKIITGPRRCGKSWLLSHIYKDYLLEHGVKENQIISVSLDLDENDEDNDLMNPGKLKSYLRESITGDEDSYYVFLDEIQEVEGFERIVNGLNSHDNVDVYVTGSNAKFLSKDIITEFRGRGDEVHMYPLTYSQFKSVYDGDKEEGWRDYVLFGGIPLVLGFETADQKSDFLKSLFEETYISDITGRNNIRNKAELEELLNILSSAIGALTNPSKLSATFKSVKNKTISKETIIKYIDYLKDSFLIDSAIRYDIKGKKYINTPSKYYFTDLGLRNARLNFRQVEETHAMENIIFNELKVRGYNVDVGVVVMNEVDKNGKKTRKQLEVDFVCNKGSKRFYIQSAYALPDKEKMEQEQRSLVNTGDGFKKIIITKDAVAPLYNDEGILVMSVYDFLLNPDSMEI